MMNKVSKTVLSAAIMSSLLSSPLCAAADSAVLTQIKASVDKITAYLLPGPATQYPTTPGVGTTAKANAASQENYGKQTILTVPNAPNKRLDQPSPAAGVKTTAGYPIYTWPKNHPTLTEQALYNALTSTSPGIAESYMADLGIYPYPYVNKAANITGNIFNRGGAGAKSYTLYNALNLDGLLGPTAYKKGGEPREYDLAMNFVRFLSNQGSPEPVPSLATLKKAKAKARSAYLVGLRSYVAAQSIGISNLNQMFARRVTVDGLGAKAGITHPGPPGGLSGPVPQTQTDASQLEVDDYVAERRVKDPTWYGKMEKAAPVTVARETLYVLAEIEKSLNDQRKTNERILATLSAMELMSADNKRLGLSALKRGLQGKRKPPSYGQ